MNFVLFGPPGAGKGTQSSFLVKRLGFLQMSTGDILRSAIAARSSLGLKAKQFMDKGDLVPDSLVIDLVKEVLARNEGAQVIFDGFPRTIHQAETLDKMLEERKAPLRKALFLEVPFGELVKRLSGRRTCSECGTLFHVTEKPPQKAGLCDACGGELIQRPDDEEGAISTRLKAYQANTFPLKEYYLKKGLFEEVDGTREPEEVFAELKRKIES